MRLRPATVADAPAVAELEAAVLGRDAWGERAVVEELAADPAARVVLVAEQDAELVGSAVLAVSGGSAELRRIAVAAAAQRSGAGRALLTALLAAACDRGCCEVFLEVAAGNAAATRLYARTGFQELYRRRRYYADGSDALVMRAPVRSCAPDAPAGRCCQRRDLP